MASIDPKKAEQLYYESKKKYDTAYNQRSISIRKENSYSLSRSKVFNQIATTRSNKRSIEKRIEDINEILDMFLGKSRNPSLNIPEIVSGAVSALAQAAATFGGAVSYSSSVAADAALGAALAVKPPETDFHITNAMDELKKEKAQLEAQLEEIKRNLAQADAQLNELNKKIALCNEQQRMNTAQMNACAAEMSYYKKYMR